MGRVETDCVWLGTRALVANLVQNLWTDPEGFRSW